MTGTHPGAETRASRIIRARPEELYGAFMDPAVLVAWLPPAGMTGKIHAFDARVGGGYRMSLFYPPDERVFRGKTSDTEDMVDVRFMELTPPRRIVEAVSFVTTDPAFLGEMTMTATFEAVDSGTEVTLVFGNLPPGLRPEDNETGSRLSLEQLARRFEDSYDDDLRSFEAHGAAPLPATDDQGHVDHDGARIWYATYGAGSPVILLHGGLGHSGNWGYQVPALISSGHRVVLIDSRGHGRSTRDSRPFMYELMASDVLAVMDALHLEKSAVVGWSDGACIALILAMQAPARIAGVFFFGCNMDPGGTKEIAQPNPILVRCFGRHARDYARLSATPDQFKAFADAVGQMMKTQPNYSARDLAVIRVPVAIVQSEFDEFIKPEHAEYLARSIPGAESILLPGVSHFALLQRPAQFNSVMRAFLDKVLPDPPDGSA